MKIQFLNENAIIPVPCSFWSCLCSPKIEDIGPSVDPCGNLSMFMKSKDWPQCWSLQKPAHVSMKAKDWRYTSQPWSLWKPDAVFFIQFPVHKGFCLFLYGIVSDDRATHLHTDRLIHSPNLVAVGMSDMTAPHTSTQIDWYAVLTWWQWECQTWQHHTPPHRSTDTQS